MNEFNVYKIPGFHVLITQSYESYPIISDDFTTELHEYKEFNIPIQQPVPKTEKDVKKLVHDNDELSISLTKYQMFVRNFMSNYTPYNGMLLFHGLGTGKTCSAITICEEYRNYLKSSGKKQSIYVLSMTDAILKNFKYQLFNESHLEKINNKWVCNSCVGDKFLQELDPYQVLPMEKQNLCKLIQSLIDDYYVFLGCAAFANNYARNTNNKTERGKMNYIQENYEGALFVMDEAHNIKDDTTDTMRFSTCITEIVTYTTVKLLMMTATPVFHNCKDFIFLSQLLNRNDKVPFIQDASKIFDAQDNFVEGGKEVLIQHLHGYVSYVKGENPYSFPYRIYPETKYSHPENTKYKLEHLQIFPVTLSEFQSNRYIQEQENTPSTGMELTVFTIYTQLAFITYPNGVKIVEAMNVNDNGKLPDISYHTGSEHFFDKEHIQKYSGKLHQLQNMVSTSEGIILIYVQQIVEGIYPIAVALEAIGYKYKDKHRRTNLCKDYSTVTDTNLSYVILNPSVVSSPIQDIITSINEEDNKDGKHIKVIIITGALTEGVDFKNIRQIHILNPWWNLSQIEQIIGRAVRFRSHKDLPFEYRNVEIFLHTAFLHDNSVQTIDYKMYGDCEQKAKKIGEVTRVLKEIAFDCRFNSVQTQSNESLNGLTVKQITSSGLNKKTPVGDIPYTVLTDYMKDCNYSCETESTEPGTKLSMNYLTSHINAIIQQIKILFNKNYVYTREELLEELNVDVPEKIDYTLSQMINNKTPIFDRFNREGYLVNIGDVYMFQPPELTTMIPTYERRIPMAYVYDTIIVETPERQKVQLDVQKIISTLQGKFDLSEKESPQKMRALGDEYLVYSAFDELYKKLVTLISVDPIEWKQDKKIIYINALMDRLTDVQCVELGKYLHSQPKLNEFEHMLKDYYKQFQVKDIYILWAYNVNRVAYYTTDWKEYVHYDYPTLQLLKKDADKNLDNKDLPLGGISASKDLSEREFKLSLPTTPNEKPRYGFKITKKPDALDILFQLIPTSPKEETKHKIEHIILQVEFCLRFFDMKKYGSKGKRWFLNPVEVIQNVARNFNLINENIKEKSKKN